MEKSLKKWENSLTVNSYIDYWSPTDKTYFSAKLIEKYDDGKYLVHFLGWDAKHDIEVDLALSKISPNNTFAKVRGEKGTKNNNSSSSATTATTTTTTTTTTNTTNTNTNTNTTVQTNIIHTKSIILTNK